MPFHQLLRDYINGGCACWKSSSVAKGKSAVCLGFSNLGAHKGSNHLDLRLSNYAGSNKQILALKDYLNPIADDLLTVILHGSVGDGNLTGYSDVDALVVLRNEVFFDPNRLLRVAKRLSASRKFMYRFDPLQHHGWFVLAEQDLSAYPESVLPLEAIRGGCVLIGKTQLSISYFTHQLSVYEIAAKRMVRKLHNQLKGGWRPRNAYQLKSFFSEFMMLPVLLLQVIHQKGYSKKDSFRDAKVHYSPRVWTAMDEVSAIRKKWKYSPGILSSMVLISTSCWLNPLRKRWPSTVPTEINPLLNEAFFLQLLEFVDETGRLLDSDKKQ